MPRSPCSVPWADRRGSSGDTHNRPRVKGVLPRGSFPWCPSVALRNAEIEIRNEGHGVPPETPIRAASAIQARAGAGIARNMLFIHTLWRAGGGC